MTMLNLSLPENLKQFVDAKVNQGGYQTAEEYVCAILQQERKREARERLEALLLEGINSGEPIEVTDQYWEEKRRRLRERFPETSEQ